MASNHPKIFLYREFAEAYRKKEWPDIFRAQFHTFVSPKIRRFFESLHDDFEPNLTVLYDVRDNELESREFFTSPPRILLKLSLQKLVTIPVKLAKGSATIGT